MTRLKINLILIALTVLTGCTAGGTSRSSSGATTPGNDPQTPAFERDRQAILGMAGTFKVEFFFEETLALRDGYELHDPYRTDAEELVVVAEDTGDTIRLQHLLVVRHDGQAHVIHHWRQDWTYCGTSTGEAGYQYDGRGTWKKPDQAMLDRCRGNWQQLVYNVDDSPRYTSWGSWAHDDGVSTWTGDRTLRPLPLRENHLAEQYDYLASVNTHVVSDKGWLHLQLNNKVDADHPTQPVLSIERGINRYERIPDQNFEKAHEYWKNTAAYWREVRSVWNEVFADKQELILAEKWKGDAMFSHLFGLADEYWGQRDLSEARPRIGQIIDAFVLEPGDKE